MSKAHQKYIREQTILSDKQQTTFPNLKPMDNFLKPKLNLSGKQLVICPFCLYREKLIKFRFSTKSGFHKSLGKCPECKQKAMLDTLLLIPNLAPKLFARFVFDYGKEFWGKCIFEKFKERLYYDKGFCRIFWEEYKRLKGEYYEE